MYLNESQQQLMVGLTRTEHSDFRVHVDIDEPGCAEEAGKPTTNVDVTTPRRLGRGREPAPIRMLKQAVAAPNTQPRNWRTGRGGIAAYVF